MCIYIYIRIGTKILPGCVCVYICVYTHRVYMCMRIFTHMRPRLDVFVYLGRVGTQSLHVGVHVVAYIHTVHTWVHTFVSIHVYTHTEVTHLCTYIYIYV